MVIQESRGSAVRPLVTIKTCLLNAHRLPRCVRRRVMGRAGENRSYVKDQSIFSSSPICCMPWLLLERGVNLATLEDICRELEVLIGVLIAMRLVLYML